MKDKGNGTNPIAKMMPKAEHMASAVMERVSEFGDTVSDKANAAVTGMGGSMTDLASTLREKSPEAVAPYVQKAAAGLEQAGAYLKRESIGEIVDDFVSLVQRHPLPLLMVGIGIGFVLSRRRRV